MTEYTDREAYEVGVLQKQYINWILLVYAIAFFIPYATWVAGIAAAYFVFKIAEAQKSPVAWLWALSQIIPFVGLVCLLILSQNATRIIKGKGIKVGLLGAKGGELDKLVPAAASPAASASRQKIAYTVHGAHRDTGHDVTLTIHAFSEEEAVKEANLSGILVSKVLPKVRLISSGPQSTTWIKVAGGIAAAVAILIVLNVLDPAANSTASATKACWRSRTQINLELMSMQSENQLAFWEQNYIRYGQIDLDNIDPDLKNLVKDWTVMSIDMHNELKQMQADLQEIDDKGNSFMKLGALLGSADSENPRGGAMAGGMLFGMLAMPLQEQAKKDLHKRHDPLLLNLNQRTKALVSKFRLLGPVLEERYGGDFD